MLATRKNVAKYCEKIHRQTTCFMIEFQIVNSINQKNTFVIKIIGK